MGLLAVKTNFENIDERYETIGTFGTHYTSTIPTGYLHNTTERVVAQPMRRFSVRFSYNKRTYIYIYNKHRTAL